MGGDTPEALYIPNTLLFEGGCVRIRGPAGERMGRGKFGAKKQDKIGSCKRGCKHMRYKT